MKIKHSRDAGQGAAAEVDDGRAARRAPQPPSPAGRPRREPGSTLRPSGWARGLSWGIRLSLGLALAAGGLDAQAARISAFSPQGEAPTVRQLTARFDAPVVRFGDPRLPDPLRLRCEGLPAGPVPAGSGRWTGTQDWVYDLREALPPGVRCELTLDPAWTPLGGALDGPTRFSFSTGGPAVVSTWPPRDATIEEDQAFLLRLSGPATPASVTARAWCEVEGLGERLGVRVIEGPAREAVLQAQGIGRAAARGNALLLACQRPFAPDARVRLVWGAGIASAAHPQVLTRQAQTLQWTVRERFAAEFRCERERAEAPCMPLRPLVLRFSAPVPRALAAQARLTPAQGTALAPAFDKDERAGTVQEIAFAAPLTPDTAYTLTLPADLRDEAGRPLANAASFPLATATGPMPPLAKFAAAPFGIAEWPVDEKTGASQPAAVPLTMRHVQADLAGLQARGRLRIKRLDAATSDLELLRWIARLRTYHESELTAKDAGLPPKDWFTFETVTDERGRPRIDKSERRVATRELSLLAREAGTTQAALPAPPPSGAPTEVIGVPLPQPGYHVLEIESQLLGDQLLAKPQPMYVRTGVLVTNLGVHFKRGRESSLVWVTTLNSARPVAGADVAINDCRGQRVWSGRTDARGLAPVPRGFDESSGDDCLSPQGWFVTARQAGAGRPTDLAFVFSAWQQGIETWRFSHPTASGTETELRAHTVFDRTLLRAGETVSMKHYLRRQTAQGLAALPAAQAPTGMQLTHVGSGDTLELPLAAPALTRGEARSIAARWTIPPNAKLGLYEVSLRRGPRQWTSGTFRVEAFKLPLVDARLSAPKGPLIAPPRLALQAQLSYLSGGAVAARPARLSALLRERTPFFAGHEDMSFEAPRERSARPPSPDDEDDSARAERLTVVADKRPLTTDAQGAATVTLDPLPALTAPADLLAELSFADPNGETQTVAQTLALWPSAVVVGVRAKSWLAQRGRVQFQAVVLDTAGQPQAGQDVTLTGRSVRLLSSRKRLVGGFYAYDEQQEVKELGTLCRGKTDARGLLLCEAELTQAGEVELIAQARDAAGRASRAATSVYVSGSDESWFAQDNDDRIDVLPAQRELAPGDTARLQVRMPFRSATALVTVEREGILDARLVTLRGSDPVVEVPIPKASWAPNVYVSVLVLRGRLREVPWYSLFQWGWRAPVDWWQAYRDEGRDWRAPGATIDLARPAYKFGVAALRIGTAAHRLDVKVTPAQPQYGVRETAQVKVQVLQDGQPAAHAEVAFAAVDEALLALQDNTSWDLLGAMFQPRAWGVETSTAQNEIIGRRHYGRKALAAGGGGGRNPTRELFDTLLLWQPDVKLDARGEAVLPLPLNDSLTSFRLVAIADAGADRFGSGSARIRVTQDLQVLAGLPAMARSGDRFEALATLRNTTTRAMTVSASLQGQVSMGRLDAPPAKGASDAADAQAAPSHAALAGPPQRVSLAAGAAQEIRWPVEVPQGALRIQWELAAVEEGGGRARDRLRVTQAIEPAVPLRVLQASVQQLDGAAGAPAYTLAVAPPADAWPREGNRQGIQPGGLQLTLRPRLAGALPGLRHYFETYPYSCLEQQASRAVGLRDAAAWQRLGQALPGHLDREGLASYFPPRADSGDEGSDRLSAYLLSLAHQAGWALPREAQDRLLGGLAAFVEGRLMRRFPAPRADLDVRKLAALEALSRYGRAEPRQLGSLALTPAQWPTAALLDWIAILRRLDGLPERAARLDEAQRLLRARLVAGGTTLRFVDEAGDAWWWLMDGPDANAARLLLAALDDPAWADEAPRLATGLVARLNAARGGAFATTPANAWATLAFERFSARLESVPVSGRTRAELGGTVRELDWRPAGAGPLLDTAAMNLPWPAAPATLRVRHLGNGRPWLAVQSLAAVPLAAPLSAGYRIERSVTPVEQKVPERYSRGDVLRVQLVIEAQAGLGWVVVSDPVPAGATLLGSGLGRDSQIAVAAAGGERRPSDAWLAYEERRPEAWRAYYAWLPRGRHTVSYTLRLNTAGRFSLPPSRVEAMYAPEHFGETPNGVLAVAP